MEEEKRTMRGDLRCGLFKELSSVPAPGKPLGRLARLYLFGRLLYIDIGTVSHHVTFGQMVQ